MRLNFVMVFFFPSVTPFVYRYKVKKSFRKLTIYKPDYEGLTTYTKMSSTDLR